MSRYRRLGTLVLLCGLQPQPLAVLKKSGSLDEFDAWTAADDAVFRDPEVMRSYTGTVVGAGNA